MTEEIKEMREGYIELQGQLRDANNRVKELEAIASSIDSVLLSWEMGRCEDSDCIEEIKTIINPEWDK